MFGFDTAKAIKTEIFVEIPEELRDEGRGFRNQTRESSGGTTLEGPSFDREGNLYITELPNGRILKISPDKKVSLVIQYDGQPNGLKIHKDGRIFVCDRRYGIMVLDPVAQKISSVCWGTEREHFKGVNDLVFGSNGDLFFTDQGATGLHDSTGHVYRLTSDGKLTSLINTIPSPNGLLLNDKENVIFVAVTRANAIWSLPLGGSGSVMKAGLWAQLPATGPDGMAADIHGNVAVANPFLGIVWVFDRKGLPIYRIETCAGLHPTNLAYGGPDNRWLYITEGDSYSVQRAEMPFPGRRMYSHT